VASPKRTSKGTNRQDVDAVADDVARLYPSIYLLLHRRSGSASERLTPQSQALLLHLTFSGPLTVSEMARHLGRAQSVVSETVDALERRGLLARIRDERDRRRTLVWLTPEAQSLLTRMGEVLDRERVAAALREMSSDERRALVDGLASLVRGAEQARRRKEPES